MNKHPAPLTEHHRKLSEALYALTGDTGSPSADLARPSARRLLPWLGLAIVLPATVLTVAVRPPDLIRNISARATALFTPDTPANPRSATAQAAGSTGPAIPAEDAVVGKPDPAPREIAGSGFVIAPRATLIFAGQEGEITDIAVEPGDRVASGQPLLTIDNADIRLALDEAKAARAGADLLLAARVLDRRQAQAALVRTRTLASRNVATGQALDAAQDAVEQAANAVDRARLEVTRARLALGSAARRVAELTVRAPFAGAVTRLDAHVGDTVLARPDAVRDSQSLLGISDTSHLVIDADVAETSIADLKPGLRGEASLDGFPDRPFSIALQRLAPVVSAEKGTITLRLTIADPPPGIRPNMAARIRILIPATGDTAHDRSSPAH